MYASVNVPPVKPVNEAIVKLGIRSPTPPEPKTKKLLNAIPFTVSSMLNTEYGAIVMLALPGKPESGTVPVPVSTVHVLPAAIPVPVTSNMTGSALATVLASESTAIAIALRKNCMDHPHVSFKGN
jgi:hypothetical protein